MNPSRPKSSTKKPVHVVIYARKSSDDKKNGPQSASVEAQIVNCREYCKKNKHVVVGEPFVDDGYSGRCWPAGKDWEYESAKDTVTNKHIAKMPKKRQRRPALGEALRMVGLDFFFGRNVFLYAGYRQGAPIHHRSR